MAIFEKASNGSQKFQLIIFDNFFIVDNFSGISSDNKRQDPNFLRFGRNEPVNANFLRFGFFFFLKKVNDANGLNHLPIG